MDKELDDELPDEEVVEEPEAKAEPDEDRQAIEEEARKYGWRPKSEFDRDPENWVDAERFLTMPKTQVKIWRDRNRDSEKTAKELESRLHRLEAMQKVALERALESQKAQYEARLQAIAQEQRAAAEVGDVEKFDRLEQQRAQMAPPPPVMPQPVQEDPLAAYRTSEEGKWVNDPAAARMAWALIEQNPHVKYLPPQKQVEWASSQVKPYFPEYFPAPKQTPTTSRVDGGGLGGGFKRSRGADDLPPEAKKTAKEFVQMGVYKSVEEYAKDYWDQEA